MSDTQARYAYPKFKVFIFGIEVSADVVNVTSTSHDGSAPNTCQITLLNELDKYILTTKDIVALNKIKFPNDQIDLPWLSGQADTTNPTEDFQDLPGGILTFGTQELADAINNGITDPMKRNILTKKNASVQTLDGDQVVNIFGRPVQGTRFANYYGTDIKQYPITDGAPVFSSMDPVRVFMRDPFNPSRWYYYFCGFISDMVDNADQNNAKTLTIVVEDPTKLFRYTRIFLNPGIVDARLAINSQSDLSAQSFYSNFLHGFTLPEVFFTMIFGPDRVGAETILESMKSDTGGSNLTTKLRGIGHFAFDTSGIFKFGPEAPQPKNQTPKQKQSSPQTQLISVKPEISVNLTQWQSILDHEVQPSDMYTMATEEARNSSTDSLTSLANDIFESQGIEGIVNQIGTYPQIYLVDGGRLLMLIPASLGVDNNRVIVKDIIEGGYPMQSEWHSAGSVLWETVDRIQFAMYCSPRGDLVVEPPLYDFDPSDFGLSPITSNQFVTSLAATGSQPSAASVLAFGESEIPGTPRGPFGQNFVVLKKDTVNWEAAFVDEKVYNMATCPHSIFQNYENQANTAFIGGLAVVTLPPLIPIYGIRQTSITPRGYIATKDGASLFAQITLNKLNADAHTFHVDAMPNIKLWLNRPIYIQGRNCLATTKQIGHSLAWGQSGDMSSSLDLYATRVWDGKVSKNNPSRPVFFPLGGAASRPLNYAILFGSADPAQASSSLGGGTQQPVSDSLGKISPAAKQSVVNSKNNGGV